MKEPVKSALILAAERMELKEHTPWAFRTRETADMANEILADRLVFEGVPVSFRFDKKNRRNSGYLSYGFYFEHKGKFVHIAHYKFFDEREIAHDACELYHNRCYIAGLHPGGWMYDDDEQILLLDENP